LICLAGCMWPAGRTLPRPALEQQQLFCEVDLLGFLAVTSRIIKPSDYFFELHWLKFIFANRRNNCGHFSNFKKYSWFLHSPFWWIHANIELHKNNHFLIRVWIKGFMLLAKWSYLEGWVRKENYKSIS